MKQAATMQKLREQIARENPVPDYTDYEIEDSVEVGPHLVMKVRYPSCSSCFYGGCKTMVWLNATEGQALKWSKIDPHFRAPGQEAKSAPSAAARFPATKEGWEDALNYATSKVRGQ